MGAAGAVRGPAPARHRGGLIPALVPLPSPWAPEAATTHHTPCPAYGSCCLRLKSRVRGTACVLQGYELGSSRRPYPVSYTHLRAHETRHDIVCRLLLEKK